MVNPNTMLSRASSKLLTSAKNRVTGGSRVNPSIGRGKNSRISRMVMSTNRDSEIYYNIDEGIDEESANTASHRCSMVKRYNLPTFFTPDKSH